MPSSGMPRMISEISDRLRSMVSNTFSACSCATSSVRSISRSAVSLTETQETMEAKSNSASGRASEAAIIHCNSLSELRCAVCTGAPSPESGAYCKPVWVTKRHGAGKPARSVLLGREDVTPLPAGNHRPHQVFLLQRAHHEHAEHMQDNQDHDGVGGKSMGVLDPPDAEEADRDLHPARDGRDREQQQHRHQHRSTCGVEAEIPPGFSAPQIPQILRRGAQPALERPEARIARAEKAPTQPEHDEAEHRIAGEP